MLKFEEKSWPIHVPAAAVRHEWQALFVFVECIIYINNNKTFILIKLSKKINISNLFIKIYFKIYKIYNLVIKYIKFIGVSNNESLKFFIIFIDVWKYR